MNSNDRGRTVGALIDVLKTEAIRQTSTLAALMPEEKMFRWTSIQEFARLVRSLEQAVDIVKTIENAK